MAIDDEKTEVEIEEPTEELRPPTLDDIIVITQDMFLRLQVSKNLVYNGKVCEANEKMQGALTICGMLLNTLGTMKNAELADKDNSEGE